MTSCFLLFRYAPMIMIATTAPITIKGGFDIPMNMVLFPLSANDYSNTNILSTEGKKGDLIDRPAESFHFNRNSLCCHLKDSICRRCNSEFVCPFRCFLGKYQFCCLAVLDLDILLIPAS